MVPAHMDTLAGYARTKLVKTVARVAPDASRPLTLRMTVATGAHAGCSTDLDGKGFIIGSDQDHDIMLIDPDIVGQEVRVAGRMTVLGPVVGVKTTCHDVALNGEPLIDGTGYERLPCSLTIGSVRLKFEDSTAVTTRLSLRLELVLIAALAIAGAAALFLSTWPEARREAVLQPAGLKQSERSATPFAAPASMEQTMVDAVHAQVGAADLGDHITVDKSQDGTVRLSGFVPEAAMPRWHQLRANLDATSFASRVINDIKQGPQLANVPPISIVRLGAIPGVVLGNGEVLHEGDFLVQDWSIESIQESGIVLTRAGEQVKVSY